MEPAPPQTDVAEVTAETPPPQPQPEESSAPAAPKPPPVLRSNQELKKIALDYVSGKIFGSWNLSEHDMRKAHLIFMPLMFMNKEDIPEDLEHIFEYYSEAGPMAMNGKPIFFSCHMLMKQEWPEFVKYVDILQEQRKFFLDDEKPQSDTTGNEQSACCGAQLGEGI